MEIWKDIEGWGGIYQISDRGRIKSFQQNKAIGKILKPNIDLGGYLCIHLYRNWKRTILKIHKIVLVAFSGHPPTNKHECNHKDGIKTNNYINNLEWLTHEENMKHAYQNGLGHPFWLFAQHKGEAHPGAKLTEKDVRQIRELAKNTTTTQKAIGEMFGMTRQGIGDIISGKNWSHVI